MRFQLAFLLALLPTVGFAVGMEDDTPPMPTETTETCEEGLVWDLETKSCLTPEETTNDDTAMMRDARELAYQGRYADASSVLDRLDPADPWVLTYRGFLARKTGDIDGAMAAYSDALAIDADHLLARSYMGQGMAEQGDLDGARYQLTEIRKRGGRGTWPEVALRLALETGTGFNY